MTESHADVGIGLRTLTEAEVLLSCILKYFKSQSESSPLKRNEALILSALDRYFNDRGEY